MSQTRAYLAALVKHFGRGHAGQAAFLLDHGRAFEPDAGTFKGRRMEAKNCFGNAAMRAARDARLTYVEGYVQALIPVHHAWLLREDGRIVDPTLSLIGLNGQRREIGDYFGVPFQTDFVGAFLIKTGTYGLLDGMTEESSDLMRGKIPAEKFLKGQSNGQ
jgi:hypothetical protein